MRGRPDGFILIQVCMYTLSSEDLKPRTIDNLESAFAGKEQKAKKRVWPAPGNLLTKCHKIIVVPF